MNKEMKEWNIWRYTDLDEERKTGVKLNTDPVWASSFNHAVMTLVEDSPPEDRVYFKYDGETNVWTWWDMPVYTDRQEW